MLLMRVPGPTCSLNRAQRGEKQQQELGQEELFVEYIVADYLFEKDRIFAYQNLDEILRASDAAMAVPIAPLSNR